jgi:hypothetical protein
LIGVTNVASTVTTNLFTPNTSLLNDVVPSFLIGFGSSLFSGEALVVGDGGAALVGDAEAAAYT